MKGARTADATSVPGNVRELDHVIERAVLMAQGTQVKTNDLGLTSGAMIPRAWKT